MVWAIATSVIAGLVVGSALGALIPRSVSGESWKRGRSHCPRCRHTLAAKDLIPLASFVLLRGRCRSCRGAIGWFYPGVEVATALLFVTSVLVRGQAMDSWTDPGLWAVIGRDWAVIAALVALFGTDLLAGVLPDVITIPAIAVIVVLNLAGGISPLTMLAGAVLGAGFFLAQYLISRGAWVGAGDIRFGAFMGVLLGPAKTVAALFVSYVIGAAVGLILIAQRKKTLKSQVPLGTFLAVGTLVALLWGDEVVRWYLSRFIL